jgi:hypothetical protein
MSPAKPKSGRIFVSYTTRDETIALEIAQALAAAGFNRWIARLDIRPGQSWVEEIERELTRASYLLLLLSPEAVASTWVSKEWMATLAAGGTVIIPVLLRDCAVPRLLQDLQLIDLRGDPVAGVLEIVEFFRRERSGYEADVREPRTERTLEERLRVLTRRQVRLVAMECIGSEELLDFSYDAGLDPRKLTGLEVNEQVRRLLHRLENDGVTEKLLIWLASDCGVCVEDAIARLGSGDGWGIDVSLGRSPAKG